MKIAVDLLSLGYGGSETYVREMIPRLAGQDLAVSLILSQGRGESLRSVLPSNVQVFDAPSRTTNFFYRFKYQRQQLPHWLKDNSVDVLFVPGGFTGTRRQASDRFRLVSMLRNMLPFDPTERRRYAATEYPWMRCRLYMLYHGCLATFRQSDRVVYISQYSRDRVSPLIDKEPGPVIPHGISRQNPAAASDELLARYGIRRPFMLYASIFDPYKHQLELIEGVKRLQTRDSAAAEVQLVLAGPTGGAYGKRVVRAAAEANAVCCGAVPHSDLQRLMLEAELLLFGSTCETCPNILLEYLAAGRAIVSSDAQPMPEFAADAAKLVTADQPHEWTEAIGQLLADSDSRNTLEAKARQRAGCFSWDTTAEQTRTALTDW